MSWSWLVLSAMVKMVTSWTGKVALSKMLIVKLLLVLRVGCPAESICSVVLVVVLVAFVSTYSEGNTDRHPSTLTLLGMELTGTTCIIVPRNLPVNIKSFHRNLSYPSNFQKSPT